MVQVIYLILLLNSKEGSLRTINESYTVDYLLGAYLQVLAQYPLDIVNSQIRKVYTKRKN